MGYDHDHGRGGGGGTRNLEHIVLVYIYVYMYIYIHIKNYLHIVSYSDTAGMCNVWSQSNTGDFLPIAL